MVKKSINNPFIVIIIIVIIALISILFYTYSHPPQSQNSFIKTQPVYNLPSAPTLSALPNQIPLSPIITGKYLQTTSNVNLYRVISVVDGDTFHVEINDKKYTIRLIGIDSPETVDPRKSVQCFGKEATTKLKELLTNQKVSLASDPTQGNTDKYNRLLRYVYREDGLFINEWMIKNGYAHEYTYVIPYQYQVPFQEAEKRAGENGLGLWNPKVCN